MPRSSTDHTKTKWERQEAGWYTHPDMGGVCYEPAGTRVPRPGWYWWPPMPMCITVPTSGPHKTMRQAMRAAERIAARLRKEPTP